jgi:hypothetical protein
VSFWPGNNQSEVATLQIKSRIEESEIEFASQLLDNTQELDRLRQQHDSGQQELTRAREQISAKDRQISVITGEVWVAQHESKMKTARIKELQDSVAAIEKNWVDTSANREQAAKSEAVGFIKDGMTEQMEKDAISLVKQAFQKKDLHSDIAKYIRDEF